jgi:hypothetical protein
VQSARTGAYTEDTALGDMARANARVEAGCTDVTGRGTQDRWRWWECGGGGMLAANAMPRARDACTHACTHSYMFCVLCKCVCVCVCACTHTHLLPGAKISTQGPKLEYEARSSRLVEAATVMAGKAKASRCWHQ